MYSGRPRPATPSCTQPDRPFGNSVATTNTFAPETGLLTAVNTGSGSVANFSYGYDYLGNLTARTDIHSGGNIYEKYCTDDLNRLTNSATGSSLFSSCTASGGGITTKTVAYDALGNITMKSDVCSTANCYLYGSGAGPHAVTSISGTGTYSHDAKRKLTLRGKA